MQYKKALQGDNTMLIWLGKQVLGQKEVKRVEAVSETPKEEQETPIDRLLQDLRDIKDDSTSQDTKS
jgi:hypothetical protein